MPSAIITGASAGIGRAIAETLAAGGYSLYLGARRQERLNSLVEDLRNAGSPKVFVSALDVTRQESCDQFVRDVLKETNNEIDVLINNAGLAMGADRFVESKPADWEVMIQTNVYGLLRVTKAVLPSMLARNVGQIINLGSVAGHSVYEGGSVYAATKHAVRAITKTLRLELNGTPIRISSIDPGMVETEFSIVRFQDEQRAKRVYAGMEPLKAKDIAEVVAFVISRPPHVNIDEVVLMPVDQASVYKVHRRDVT